MTQKLRVILVGLVVSLMSQATFAQYAASAQQVEYMEQTKKKTEHDGQRAMNISRTIMLTGASIAMTGFVTGVTNTVLGNGNDASALVLYTALGCYYGGLVALAQVFPSVGWASTR